MGYRVDYEPVQKQKTNGRVIVLTVAFFLAFVLMRHVFFPGAESLLRELLLPGDAAVTAAAWEDLTLELRSGQPIGSAVENFCREIIRNAGLSQG